MILICVGNIGPFNRLVRTVDTWAKTHPKTAITAQIGAATFQPMNFTHVDFFTNDTALNDAYDNADLLVCDLSVEVLLPAIERSLPVAALARLSIFGEETGIKQVTLAKHLKSDDFIQIAADEFQLIELLSLPRTTFKAKTQNARTQVKSNIFQSRLAKAMDEAS